MADGMTVRLHGLDALKRTLNALPVRLEKRVIMAALRAAAQVIRKDAQSRAPVLKAAHPYRRPGTVRKAITVRRSRNSKLGVYVGVKGLGAKQIRAFKADGGKSNQNPDDPWYWIFQEFGTQQHPPNPFLRPAFEARKFEAIRRFEEYVKVRAVKEAEKLARETGMKAA